MEKKTCDNCRHFFDSPEHGEGIGVCRRYPPKIIPVVLGTVVGGQQQGFQSMYPAIQEAWICGEYDNVKKILN